MAKKKYVVSLSAARRGELLTLVKGGQAKARTISRAHGLLLADEGYTDERITQVLRVRRTTVHNWRRRFVEEGLEAALEERPRPGAQAKLDARGEATLVALACTDAPQGRECWTMQLLADQLVELGVVESISDETVRRTLKKTRSSRGKRNNGASPR